VVDGKYRFGWMLNVTQKHRNQSRLPIIAVHNFWLPVQLQLAGRHHGTNSGEQVESVRIVPPVFTVIVLVRAVARAVKQGRAIDQPQSNRSSGQTGLPERHIVLAMLESGFSS